MAYKSSIPSDAVESVDSRYPSGVKKSAAYFVGRDKVGYREWYENGQLDFEHALNGGEKHGHQYRFYENGQMLEQEIYRRGTLHGTGKQWAEDGRLLVTWKFTRGVGLDLWCDTETGTLSEEHFRPKQGQVGYARMWNTDEKTVYQEYFYLQGHGYHGIWREWNPQGRMRRGFPHFYVKDKRIPKRLYAKASATDASLISYRQEDDRPQRALPAEYLAQKMQRRQSRRRQRRSASRTCQEPDL